MHSKLSTPYRLVKEPSVFQHATAKVNEKSHIDRPMYTVTRLPLSIILLAFRPFSSIVKQHRCEETTTEG